MVCWVVYGLCGAELVVLANDIVAYQERQQAST